VDGLLILRSQVRILPGAPPSTCNDGSRVRHRTLLVGANLGRIVDQVGAVGGRWHNPEMSDYFIANFPRATEPNERILSIRCPRCRKQGVFESIVDQDLTIHDIDGYSPALAGMRRCPDPTCRALVFFVASEAGEVTSYPPETIDFDTTDLPAPIVEALTEAVTCQAHACHNAAAMMVRKCLEEVCSDRDAKGDNLKARIKALGAKALMPGDLFDGLDDLRLLGNDAAHVESKDYDDVGMEEVEVGIAFTKEVLKATYQYASLRKQLASLKKQKAE
jgi:hypothetical protein